MAQGISTAVKLMKNKKMKKRWYRVCTILAAIVVFVTTYALILPAITEESVTFCALAEHSHEDTCYSTEYICTEHTHGEDCTELQSQLCCALLSVEPHTHGEECYGEGLVLVCEQTECEGHTHDESCVQRDLYLACTLPEDETHTHNEGCFFETETLLCGMEEAEGHAHGEACYAWQENVLLCDLPEGEGHSHDESCYEEISVSVCDIVVTHEHTEECAIKNLTCELEEHTHELICYADANADLEAPDQWERGLPYELTGVYAEDLLAVARTQLGYRESSRNYIVTEDGVKKGYSRYGEWYGDAYGDWCAMYICFCIDYAGIPEFPYESGCQSWVKQLDAEGLYYPAADYAPEPGDIVFFDLDGDVTADHVGIVESVGEELCTIEGNTADSVAQRSYCLVDPTLMGYAALPEAGVKPPKRALEGNYTNVSNESGLQTNIRNKKTHIKLTASFTNKNALTLPNNANIVIDLNGKTLTHNGNSAMFTIPNGTTLTIWDSSNSIKVEVSEEGGDMYGRLGSMSGSTLTYYVTETRVTDPNLGLTDETLRKYVVSGGGAIKANGQVTFNVTGGTLNLESGMIYGGTNRAISQSNGTVNLNGGYICGFTKSFTTTNNMWGANPANEFGGAAYLTGGTMNISGTVVAANSASSGGAVYVTGGTLNITGGVLAGNAAKSMRETGDGCQYFNGGGAVYVHNSARVNMSGGYMTNNDVFSEGQYWDGGGAVFVDDSARFVLAGGYLTGNIAHGGGAVRTGWYSQAGFEMHGGFMTHNVAREAEGGALFLGMESDGANGSGGGIITAGYVTNNIILYTEHWGGGGLFCSDGSSLELRNLLVTQNTAGGFGGGIAGCSTGHIYLYETEGGLVYNNDDCVYGEPHFSGGASDKPYDRQICDEFFQQNDHEDYFCALESAVTNVVLGGEEAHWTGSADGVPVHAEPGDVLVANTVMGLTSHPTEAAIVAAEEKAQLYVTGNHSYTHGGGILCNGTMRVGGPDDLHVSARLVPEMDKMLADANSSVLPLEGYTFTAEITDELGNVVSTGLSQPNGAFFFDKELVFNKEGTFTYYIREKNDGEYPRVQYDTSLYRLSVTVKRNAPVNFDIESKRYDYCITKIVLEKRDTDGTWKTLRTMSGSYTGSMNVELFGDDYAFTNIYADFTNVKAVKKWSSTQGASSVTVDLYQNDILIGTQTLNSGNGWSYTWENLPVVDENEVPYIYTVHERSPSGYSPEYFTSIGGSLGSRVLWIPATELIEGEKYVIVSPDGKKALYERDASYDYAFTTSDVANVTVKTGSLAVGGQTYSKWIEGDLDAHMVFSAVVPSDLSEKGGNQGLTLKNNGTTTPSWLLVQEADGNYLKGTSGDKWCSLFVMQNGMLKGHDGFQWNPNNLRTVVYSGSKFNTTTGTSNAAAVYRKVVTPVVSGTQIVTIVNEPAEQARYGLNITKRSSKDQSPLVGAEFNLLDVRGQALYFTGSGGIYTLADNKTSGATTKLVTAKGGKLLINGLPAGSYTLRETLAPEGHMPIQDQDIQLGTQDGTRTIYLTIDDPVYGYILPQTGGTGTYWYTLGGVLLLLAGSVLLYHRKRHGREDVAL